MAIFINQAENLTPKEMYHAANKVECVLLTPWLIPIFLNPTEFFKKFGVPVMSLRALFNFVTDLSITDDNIEKYLETAEEIALQS